MWAQFIATLTQAPSVQSVSLKVGGNKVVLPGVPAAPSSLVQGGLPDAGAPAPTSVVLRQGSVLRRIDPARLGGADDGHRLPPGPGGELPGIPAGWNALALSRDGAEVAGVGAARDRLARWRGGRMTLVPRFAGNLTRPAYDGLGGLWVGGLAAGAGKVFALDPGAGTTAPRALDVPWLAGRRLVSLRVSPDDQRVVMVSTGPTGSDARVYVAGVVRAPNGQVRSLAAPLRVAPTLTSAADASWVDGRTVSVLGSGGATDPLRPYLAGIGSGITPLAPVPGAVSVTGTGGPRGVVVVTDHGEILTRAGNGWVVDSVGSDLLVPGG